MARMAPSVTGDATSVSHTPCARFTPPTRSHSMVMARISDCTRCGAMRLRRRFAVAVPMRIMFTTTAPLLARPRRPYSFLTEDGLGSLDGPSNCAGNFVSCRVAGSERRCPGAVRAACPRAGGQGRILRAGRGDAVRLRLCGQYAAVGLRKVVGRLRGLLLCRCPANRLDFL